MRENDHMTRNDIIERFDKNTLSREIRVNCVLNTFLDEWERPHRFYHNLSHLSFLLEQISYIEKISPEEMPTKTREIMELISLFHDVSYSPKSWDNEEKSINFIRSFEKILNLNCPEISIIFDTIRDTKYSGKDLCNEISELFCSYALDLHSLILHSPAEIMKSEINLLKEFQWIDYPSYKKQRMQFLENFKYCEVSEEVKMFVENYRPKIGVYPGSFSPFHCGHMNILEQAEKIFDKVIVAVGNNPVKDSNVNFLPWSPQKILPFHEVNTYDGLLSDYLKTIDYADVTVIRGLRSGYDLDYEMNQLRVLEDYGCKLPVIYFLCNKEHSHVSSSMIRGLSDILPRLKHMGFLVKQPCIRMVGFPTAGYQCSVH